MSGAATPAQIAAFGVSMRMKRPSAAEVRELADTMLAYARRVPTDAIGTDMQMPATPLRVWTALQGAKAAAE